MHDWLVYKGEERDWPKECVRLAFARDFISLLVPIIRSAVIIDVLWLDLVFVCFGVSIVCRSRYSI